MGEGLAEGEEHEVDPAEGEEDAQGDVDEEFAEDVGVGFEGGVGDLSEAETELLPDEEPTELHGGEGEEGEEADGETDEDLREVNCLEVVAWNPAEDV